MQEYYYEEETGRKGEMPKQFGFCKVCRLNHDQGKGHKYSAKHKQRLAQLLSKAQQKIRDVTFFLKNASWLREEDRLRNKFWCSLCEEEILEDDSLFVCSNTIRHLASSKHVGNVKKFWFENGADVEKRHLFIIRGEELAKWEDACKALSASASRESSLRAVKNIHPDCCSSKATSCEVVSVSTFANSDLNIVEPLPLYKDGDYQCSKQENGRRSLGALLSQTRGTKQTFQGTEMGLRMTCELGNRAEHTAQLNPGLQGKSASMNHGEERVAGGISNNAALSSGEIWRNINQSGDVQSIKPDSNWSGATLNGSYSTISQVEAQVGSGLTCIRKPSSAPMERNARSEAPPPWLQMTDQKGATVTGAGGTFQPLSRAQERRLKKLRNPKRVGAAWAEKRRAELEREKQGEPLSRNAEGDISWLPSFGRVWQSGTRRETRKEFEAENRLEINPGKCSQIETPNTLQPYVSKRQHQEVTQEEFEAESSLERNLAKISQIETASTLQPYVSKRQRLEASTK